MNFDFKLVEKNIIHIKFMKKIYGLRIKKKINRQICSSLIIKSCSRRSSQCIRLKSDKPQTSVFFVFSCFTKKWANSVTFLIGRFPLNRQIFKLDHEWRILIKEELNLNIFHPPFCPTAAEILHQPPSLPPHPPPICLTPIFLQFKGWTLPKLQNSLYMSQVQN